MRVPPPHPIRRTWPLGRRWRAWIRARTRPVKSGMASMGSSSHDSKGELGGFRWFLFVVQPTRSPRQPQAALTNTLFSEIDVHTAATLAKAGDAVVVEPAPVEHVWVVFKTHLDIGYTDRIEDVLKKYRVEHDGQRAQGGRRLAQLAAGKAVRLDPGRLAARRTCSARSRTRPQAPHRAGRPRRRDCLPRDAVHACTPRRTTWRTWCAAWAFPRGSPASTAAPCRSGRR